jgi:carboxypeptidase D
MLQEYNNAISALDKCMSALNTTEPTPHIGLCEFVMGATVQHLQQTYVIHISGCHLNIELFLNHSVNGKEICLNVYDIRLVDDFPACGMNWPPDLTYITPYLDRDDVKTVLHATEHAEAWTECRAIVGANLEMKKSLPSVRLLPKLLEKIPVMLFSGDQDFICNYMGTERLIEALEWNGGKGFGVSNISGYVELPYSHADTSSLYCTKPNTKPAPWKLNGTEVGQWTTERNMTYVKVTLVFIVRCIVLKLSAPRARFSEHRIWLGSTCLM